MNTKRTSSGLSGNSDRRHPEAGHPDGHLILRVNRALMFVSLLACLLAQAQETPNNPKPATSNAPASLETNAAARSEISVPQTAPTNTATWAGTNAPATLPTNSPGRLDYASFRIITERNIFDPNRGPRRSAQRSTQRSSGRRTRSEGFSLIGTAISEGGAVAFFDGTESKYRKMLKPADAIADFKLVEIAPNYVKLQSEGKEVTLLTPPAQTQLRKIADGAWELVTGTATEKLASGSEAGENAVAEKADDQAAEAPGGNTATDEILRKLMQKREQELKNEKP
jgi:hypothetical protein